MVFNTITVGAAVTPEIVSCAFSHYYNRKPLRQKPTARLSYHEGLRVVRQFIDYASHHTVEDIQAFTSQWVPAPRWVKLKALEIPSDNLKKSAEHIQTQLGEDGIEAVGGREWWQWRQGDGTLKAEWIEMRSDYNARKRSGAKGNRVILYIHGGAYYFGSVDEHRYQMQRHARKLKARCLAPRYRLSPQYPFPCGLQDCLATYLHLLKENDPSEILLAGDSAGGGMTLAMLMIIRDQGIPLPAGAILLSPWVDLTHSFPSLGGHGRLDYIPPHGFHHRPSQSWPAPPKTLSAQASDCSVESSDSSPPRPVPSLSVSVDGHVITITDQIQMYAPNHLLTHPLVSPVLAPSLGGLPPLLVQAGGGELLVDEQVYIAHKAANPTKYLPSDEILAKTDPEGDRHKSDKPTDVQLQVWDDLCHVTHTLSWTRPAKYMYRGVAQFGAWALARAQQQGIDILDDDNVSEISFGSSSNSLESSPATNDAPPIERERTPGSRLRDRGADEHSEQISASDPEQEKAKACIGKAGDPLPRFQNHMIRQRVDRHGDCYPLPPPSDIAALNLPRESIGTIKEGPAKRWLAAKAEWDSLFASSARKVAKQREKQKSFGYVDPGPGERPPATALAGRRRLNKDGEEIKERRKSGRSWGMTLWSLWGSKHDEKTLLRENRIGAEESTTTILESTSVGEHTQESSNTGEQPSLPFLARKTRSRSNSQNRATSKLSSTSSAHYAKIMDIGQAGSMTRLAEDESEQQPTTKSERLIDPSSNATPSG